MNLTLHPDIVRPTDRKNSHRLLTRLLALSCLIISVLYSVLSYAQEASISIVYSGEKTYTRKVIKSLYEKLDSLPLSINTININNEPLSRSPIKNSSLLISLGTKATEKSLELNSDIPLLSLLIPSQSYTKLSKIRKKNALWKVIFIDQPFDRQIHFIQILLGKDKVIGTILGSYSKIFKNRIKQAAQRNNQKIRIETIATEKQLIPTLKPLVKLSDAILAIPDPITFNKRTIRSILLLSYHQGVPLIGFSRSYVKAGAIAAIFSDPEQISQQTAAIIKKYIQNGTFVANASYADDFSIALNKTVARTLSIYLPDEKTIYQRMLSSKK